ncbi:outer membrane protein beta-barrel domain protein [Bacteriovorax sp. BAL6_X]|uniref:outer membrane beta-barrel protein n=1 Tax=Bacteriovorax sp. BAL6_X TaxID=1201290 RepID=UPI0003862B95|nr:outer membrane beta-barrel protein [Bacteriovorax sp. BAL6_X]EPZ50325.1 outer membrane protein beta-barrel domain protein [Bacteriovorax sp. BAL6_X]
MKKILIAMMIMIAGFQAQAGIYVEPYLAYNILGETDGDDTTGTNIGGRLGYSLPMLVSFGLDYNMGSYTIDSALGDVDADTTNLGAFVAVDLPILLRGYASYYFSSDIDTGSVSYDGSGIAVGVGFTMLPFVSLNLEYRAMSYDGSGAVSDFDAKEILVGISVPLDL